MNFNQILILIIVIILGIIAVRISFNFKFDLNKYLENRRKIKIDRLKNICPHCKIEFVGDNQIKVESYFHSPIGTTKYICSRCNRIVESEEDAQRMAENYAKDPKRFLKNEKRFVKAVKRLGLS